MVVAKLKGARERKRTLTGKKVEGRKSHAELRPELVALVRQLRRKRPKGGQRSLREIAAELAQRGHLNERDRQRQLTRCSRGSLSRNTSTRCLTLLYASAAGRVRLTRAALCR
jgi:hypothetical protein